MTFIKVCGITNLLDARLALELGADLLGFNFFPPSPRSVTPLECALITSHIIREFPDALLVGVFVNMPVEDVKAVILSCALHLAQLHGDEPPHDLQALDGKGLKAFRGVPTSEALLDYAKFPSMRPPHFLVDASVHGLYGGSGVTADWPAAALLAAQHPLLLAGGLKSGNVAEAVQQVHPWGVDTASGVEASPRKKDPALLKAFIQSVRSA